MKKKKEAPGEQIEANKKTAEEFAESIVRNDPMAVDIPQEPVDPYADLAYPCIALVRKYADAVPVQVKDRTHLNRLINEHGANSLEIQ